MRPDSDLRWAGSKFASFLLQVSGLITPVQIPVDSLSALITWCIRINTGWKCVCRSKVWTVETWQTLLLLSTATYPSLLPLEIGVFSVFKSAWTTPFWIKSNIFFLDLFQSEACEVGKAPETPRWNTTLKPKKNDSAIVQYKRHQIRVKRYTCIFINTKLKYRTGLHTLTHWPVTSHSNCTT